MAKTITVKKRGYRRKAYRRKDGTEVKAATVKPTTFKIKDRGKPGRGPKLIKIKGHLDGYHVDLSAEERHAVLRKAVKKYGIARVWRRLHAMVIMRKREQPAARAVFERDRDWVADTFGTKSLTPRAAIKARRK
jgi:hypothetical protein